MLLDICVTFSLSLCILLGFSASPVSRCLSPQYNKPTDVKGRSSGNAALLNPLLGQLCRLPPPCSFSLNPRVDRRIGRVLIRQCGTAAANGVSPENSYCGDTLISHLSCTVSWDWGAQGYSCLTATPQSSYSAGLASHLTIFIPVCHNEQ